MVKLADARARIRALTNALGLGHSDLLSVLQGAVFTLSVQVGAAVVSYVSQVVLARWMGAREFGVYTFAWTMVSPFAAAAAIGMAAAAARFIPQYLTQNRIGYLLGYVRRSLMLVAACGIGVGSVGWLLLAFPGDFLAAEYIAPTRIATLSIPFVAVIVLLSGISRGFSWAGLASVPLMLMIPIGLLLSLGVYTVLVGMPSSSVALLIYVGVTLAVALFHYFAFRGKLTRELSRTVPVYETWTWLRVALPLFLADGLVVLLWNVDVVMLASMKTPEDVAIYHACTKTAGLSYIVFNAVRGFSSPKFSALIHQDDRERQQRFVRSIARMTVGPTLLAAIALTLAGKFILGTFGAAFVAGYPVLLALMFGHLLRSATGPLSAYLAVSGNQDTVLWTGIAAALLNALLNLALIPRYGILGAAGATVVSVIVLQAVLYSMVYRKLGLHSIFFKVRSGVRDKVGRVEAD